MFKKESLKVFPQQKIKQKNMNGKFSEYFFILASFSFNLGLF
jgi:hypothetical protein